MLRLKKETSYISGIAVLKTLLACGMSGAAGEGFFSGIHKVKCQGRYAQWR
jgi:hypothetical protein